MERLSVNVVLDDLIRQLRKESRRANNAPMDYKLYYSEGFQHALSMVSRYRNELIEKHGQLRHQD